GAAPRRARPARAAARHARDQTRTPAHRCERPRWPRLHHDNRADRNTRAMPRRARARARCSITLGWTRARESNTRRPAARNRAPARPLHTLARAPARATVPARRARTARAQTHARPTGTEGADSRGGAAVAEVVTDPREL